MLALLHAEFASKKLVLELWNARSDLAVLLRPLVDRVLDVIATLLVVMEVGRQVFRPARHLSSLLEGGLFFEGESRGLSGELSNSTVNVSAVSSEVVRVVEISGCVSSVAIGILPIRHGELTVRENELLVCERRAE